MSNAFHATRKAQSLEIQLGRLSSQVGHLKGRVKSLNSGLSLKDLPAWEIVRMDPGTALSGADWDPLFDDETANNRIQHSIRTASGEMPHVNSDSSATRARIRFTAQGEGQLLMKLGVIGTGSVQVKCNGNVATYTSGAFIPIDVLAPPMTNEVVVSADGTAGAFQFSLDGLLFDGVHRKWVSY